MVASRWPGSVNVRSRHLKRALSPLFNYIFRRKANLYCSHRRVAHFLLFYTFHKMAVVLDGGPQDEDIGSEGKEPLSPVSEVRLKNCTKELTVSLCLTDVLLSPVLHLDLSGANNVITLSPYCEHIKSRTYSSFCQIQYFHIFAYILVSKVSYCFGNSVWESSDWSELIKVVSQQKLYQSIVDCEQENLMIILRQMSTKKLI